MNQQSIDLINDLLAKAQQEATTPDDKQRIQRAAVELEDALDELDQFKTEARED